MRGYLKGELRDRVREVVAACMANKLDMPATQESVERITGVGLREGAIKHLKREVRAAQHSAPVADDASQGAGGKAESPLSHNQTAFASGFNVYTFTGEQTERPALPRFDGEPHVYGDCIVSGDFHLPTTDYHLADLLLDVARVSGIKTLLIVGDLLNMDAFSSFPHIIPPIPFTTEARAAIELIDRYAAWFDVMWLALGNHEHRLLKLSKGELDSTLLGQMLSGARGKLRMTPYSHIVVHSGNEVWRCTHQRSYSKIKGRVGDELAQKFQCNIVAHHQHHAGKIMDRYGRYVIIDNGGLHEQNMIAYASLVDNIAPAMTKGFTVIRGGCGHLITPYPAYTDMNEWLAEAA